MGLWELLVIAVGVSMDAFAIAICKGLSVKKWRKSIYCRWAMVRWCASSDAIAGLSAGKQHFRSVIENVDHWLSFALLQS